MGTRIYVRMSGRFCRALCYRSAEFVEKAVEVFPKQGLCIGRGFLRGPTPRELPRSAGGSEALRLIRRRNSRVARL